MKEVERRHREAMIAVLEEMNREDPPTPEDGIAGEELWQLVRSASNSQQSDR